MLISMNWIQDFVDLSGLDIEALIQRFTLSTAEVEDIFYKGRDVRGVVAARIEQVEKHPDSKKLHLLRVNTGQGIVDCVCGAPNAREGMLVAFAKAGGCVQGMEIREATVAGYPSSGMCCSEAELGISADNSGLLELDADAVLGTDIKDIIDMDDIIFEVDNKSLTNRPDLWGHYGIAREFSALTGRSLKPVPGFDIETISSLPPVDITLVDTEHAFRYTSVIVENVTRRVSPVNMRVRLYYCGMRAINFLADLTNYLMLELGQPMHAFDYRRVNKVEVQRFAEPFDFQTLDGVTRRIDDQTLMICSHGKPVGVAGVMGGLDSEIVDDTTSLLLESANFDGVSIRKSSTRLGLRTDASMRYEKVLDPELTMTAAQRYLNLLLAIDPGARIVSRMSDVYVKSYPEIEISFDKAYIDRYTGIDISADQIERTLLSLGFGVQRKADAFQVEVPSWRRTKDVTIKADLLEEITRIYGYDNFEIKPSDSLLAPVPETENRRVDYGVKCLLTDRYGLHEVHSYIWNDARRQKEIGIEAQDNVRIINSLSTDWTVLRRSMIPTLLTMVCDNKLFAPSFGVYEIGRVVDGVQADGTCCERKKLGVILFERGGDEKAVYLRMKDMLQALGLVLKNSAMRFVPRLEELSPWQHPVNTADILLGGACLGSFAVIHPSVQQKIDKKAVIVCAELDMDLFAAAPAQPMQYEEPSRYPGVEVDLTLLVPQDVPFAALLEAVRGGAGPLLRAVKLVDTYAEPGQRQESVTVRLEFCSDERTLAGDEVQAEVNAALERLKANAITLKS